MSKSAPAKNTKSDIIRQLMLVATIFLGFQLFVNGNKQPEDKRTSQEVFQKMQEMNRDVLDYSIVPLRSVYENKLNDEVKAGKLSEADKTKDEIAGGILVADAQLKGSLYSNQIKGAENAYSTLQAMQRKYSSDPAWKTYSISVPSTALGKTYDWSGWTGDQLYAKTVSVLGDFNKKDLVIGLLPGYQMIDFLVHVTGAVPAFSYGFAAILLALSVRMLVWPLSRKQYSWSRQMQQLTPLTEELKKQYGDDKTTLQVKTMELYKEYGINPAAGCLPLMIQLPFFIIIYRCMLHYRFEFQKGTFLWINQGLSEATHGFFAPNLGMEDSLLIILYTISMVVTTFLQPASSPDAVKQQRMIGIMTSLFFGAAMLFHAFPVPAAFVLYWTFTNVIATAQSLYAYRQPIEPLKKVNAPNGAVFTMPGFGTNGTNGKNGSTMGTPLTMNKTGVPKKHKPKKRK